LTALILARAISFLGGALLLGIPAVLVAAVLPPLQDQARLTSERLPPLLSPLLRVLWGAGAAVLLSGMLWFLLQAASISGRGLDGDATPTVLVPVLWRTHFGHAMLARLILTVLALAGLAFVPAARTPHRRIGVLAIVALLAAADFAALAWAAHAVVTPGATHLVADIAHLLAAGLWLGGLVVLAALFATRGGKPDATWIAVVDAATRRFSRLGLACVALLLASGIVESWFLVGTIPALVGTAYGHLLLVKLALFATMITLAAVNRFRLTPRIGQASRKQRDGAEHTLGRLRRNTLAELILGGLVLLVVGALGAIAPGVHDQPWWPFPYRFGGDALQLPEIRVEIAIALTAVILGFGLCLAGLTWRRHRSLMILVGLALLVSFLPNFRILLIAAYPTSFYASPVPYTAESIARGASLYPANCAACHGPAGRGDGPAAAALKVPPADLTAAHVLDHSPGDIFWWLSAGIGESGMPGFADRLSEGERWDLVNWVRTLPAGRRDGGLTASVGDTSGAPAPDFSFDAGEGGQETLRDRLERGPLLLVFLDRAAAPARLGQLATIEPGLTQQGVGLLVVAPASSDALPADALPAGTMVGAEPIAAAAYGWLAGPQDGQQADLEFLVDRDGNARAVWRPGAAPDWRDGATLLREAAQLVAHPLAPAAPPAHIH
jgi:putative copper export protein/mono/diheme cytochrome c family protein